MLTGTQNQGNTSTSEEEKEDMFKQILGWFNRSGLG
jgi:hypothetical protein